MIVIKTLITILYQRTLNIQEVQLSLGSHGESLAKTAGLGPPGRSTQPAVHHPQHEFDLEYFCSKELKNLHLHPSPIQDFPFL